jgi:hypothetical protein
MRLEPKDWILLAIAVLLAAVAIFEENTFLVVVCIGLTGLVVSSLILIHSNLQEWYRPLLITATTLSLIGSAYYIKPSIERLMVPDRSKLLIANHTGNIALALDFLNSTHLFIAGKFVYHGFTVDLDNN